MGGGVATHNNWHDAPAVMTNTLGNWGIIRAKVTLDGALITFFSL